MKKLAYNLNLLAISLFAGVQVAFAENDSDFFAAAEGITLPTDETSTGATVPAPQAAEKAAEQAQQGGNFLDLTKEFFSNLGGNIRHGVQGFTGKLQEFGNFIGDKLNGITGGNPLVSKIAVALVLVLISIVIIVVLVLIAKKFVHKAVSNPFQAQPFWNTNFDNFNDIENLDDDDDNLDVDEQSTQPSDNSDGTDDGSEQVTSEEQTTLIAPTDIQGAMKNFLNITE